MAKINVSKILSHIKKGKLIRYLSKILLKYARIDIRKPAGPSSISSEAHLIKLELYRED